MSLADRFLFVRRDPHSEEVLARGGHPEAHSILQRTGFVPVVRVHENYHRLPTGLDDAEEIRLATRAVARLRSAGHHVTCDDDFDSETTEAHYPTIGDSVAETAERIQAATTTGEVTDALTELTAPHDGVLTALDDALAATADFHQSLGTEHDSVERLLHVAQDALGVLASSLGAMRNAMADVHVHHPLRRECSAEVGPDEREASATCACPPPAPLGIAAPGPISPAAASVQPRRR